LQGFGAVPPLVADIDLSMDDRFLYAACCGTGEMRQYDVTDPRKPRLVGSVHIGGISRCTPHANGKTYAGGPQMVEISRDGKRVYWTNSLYSTSLRSRFAELFPAVASASKITWRQLSST
jgi:selenium-binding protein 1